MWRSFREIIEAITVALLLALLIRHFVLESYEIPTGSMAPYLHGLNAQISCPNCATKTPVGISSDSLTNKVRMGEKYRLLEGTCNKTGTPFKIRAGGNKDFICPSCKETRSVSTVTLRTAVALPLQVTCRLCTFPYETLVEPADVLGGNKILVDKFEYDLDNPDRWDVIVFRFNSQRNYIKRLVGLPGETVEIKHGDVWINGKLEVKPPKVQAGLWIPIHDSRVEEYGLIPSAWEQTPNWTRSEGEWAFNELEGTGEISYVRPIDNFYGYNASYRGSPPAPIRDLKMEVQLRVSTDSSANNAAISLEIENSPSIYRWRIPISKSSEKCTLTIDSTTENKADITEKEIEGLILSQDAQTKLEIAVVDRQIRLYKDGSLVYEYALPESEYDSGISSPKGQPLRIRATKCGGYVESVRIFRDLHWTKNGNYATTEEFKLDEDRYFVLGDNSPSSLDSRYWGSFSRTNLLGKGFLIFWPALPWRNESGFIR